MDQGGGKAEQSRSRERHSKCPNVHQVHSLASPHTANQPSLSPKSRFNPQDCNWKTGARGEALSAE